MDTFHFVIKTLQIVDLSNKQMAFDDTLSESWGGSLGYIAEHTTLLHIPSFKMHHKLCSIFKRAQNEMCRGGDCKYELSRALLLHVIRMNSP